LKISVLRETFVIDYIVALTFIVMQPICSVQRDEKTQPITNKSVSKQIFLHKARKEVFFPWGGRKKLKITMKI
jgi:flagellar biosynthesis protein FliP